MSLTFYNGRVAVCATLNTNKKCTKKKETNKNNTKKVRNFLQIACFINVTCRISIEMAVYITKIPPPFIISAPRSGGL